ncbi:rhodopsin, G0-coupled [Hydra vulgaris]|uniref:Rhodopsin, G0-coupled n=1 Tax=Hydra vulgaris TaxID=6087 RepID=A0ABM4DJD9_HYDVU
MELLVAVYSLYVLSLIILSTTLNLIICYIIISKIKAIEMPHLFILSISISDILHTSIGLVSELCVLHGATTLKKSYTCIGASFLTYSFTVSNIMQMVMISIVRVIALKFPIFYFNNCKKMKFRLGSLFLCYFYGFLWPAFPLLGWSTYEIDLDKRRCSLDWNLTKSNSFTYLMFAFIFCYIFPAIVLVWSLNVTKKTVDEQRETSFRKNRPNEQMEILEKVYLKIFLCSAIAYFLIWTPYASATLLSIFRIKTPSVIFTFCALFAKSSAISNALVNCYMNKSFQVHLNEIRVFSCFIRENRVAPRITNASVTEETQA